MHENALYAAHLKKVYIDIFYIYFITFPWTSCRLAVSVG